MKESGTECSHMCSFAVFSRVVIGSVQSCRVGIELECRVGIEDRE